MLKKTLLKIVLLGDPSVGKEKIREQYLEKPFHHDLSRMMTIGADFALKTLKFNNQTIKLQIWDLAGQPRFSVVRSVYYYNVEGGIIVYDISNRETFKRVGNWVKELWEHNDRGKIPFVLVGHNPELRSYYPNTVSMEEGMTLANDYSNMTKKFGFEVPYYDISTQTGQNIEECFTSLVRAIILSQIRKEGLIKNKINATEEATKVDGLKETFQVEKDTLDEINTNIHSEISSESVEEDHSSLMIEEPEVPNFVREFEDEFKEILDEKHITYTEAEFKITSRLITEIKRKEGKIPDLILQNLAKESQPSPVALNKISFNSSYAMFVGINNYSAIQSHFRPLKFAVSDACAITNLFIGKGLLNTNTRLFININENSELHELLQLGITPKEPLKTNLLLELEKYQNISEMDTFLFFFAGHGISLGKMDYLIPMDGAVSRETRQTALAVNDVLDRIQSIPAKTKILFIDACRDIPTRGIQSFGNEFYKYQYKDIAYCFLSCRPEQVAYESEKFHHGVFTYYLLEGLNGNTINPPITLNELMKYVKESVQTFVLQEHNAQQNPILLLTGTIVDDLTDTDLIISNS